MDICSFCGNETEVAGTSMTDVYCVDCLRLTIAECKAAINEIKGGSNKAKRLHPHVSMERMNAAFNNLVSGPTNNGMQTTEGASTESGHTTQEGQSSTGNPQPASDAGG